MSAATRLRRLNEHASITVLERGEYVSFANCGLPYHLSDTIADRESLLLHTPETLAVRFRLDVRTRHDVLGINRAAHTVSVRDLDAGTTEDLVYDKLILSPGAAAVRPPLPGVDKAFVLRSVTDLDHLKDAVVGRGDNVVVVGAGFIGVEVAENLVAAGKCVTIIEAAPQVLPPLDAEMAAIVAEELRRHDVTVHLGVDEGFTLARRAHPAFLVDGIDALAARLADAGAAVLWDHELVGVRRCYVADPFGNRIELIAAPTTP